MANDLETQVMELIGEDTSSPDVFTTAGLTPIRDSINAAVAELCMVTGSYTRTYHLPLYEDRHFYRMDWGKDEFGYVLECWDRERQFRLGQTDLVTLARTDPWFLKAAGNPERYFQVGQDFIGFDRAPSVSGKVLEVFCVAIPAPYATDQDPVRVREVFRRATVEFSVSEFFASRGDAVRAKTHHERYLEVAGIMALHPLQAQRTFEMTQAKDPANVHV
jgi:hypothetical protein